MFLRTGAGLLVALVMASMTWADTVVPPTQKTVKTNDQLAKNRLTFIPAKKTKFPLIVYGEEKGMASSYAPSGFMGDPGVLKIKSANESAPLGGDKKGSNCLRLEVLPKGNQGWVGLYWQTPANNWGKIKGAGYDLSKATKLTFWMRGEKGGERLTEVRMGGLVGPYPDTDAAAIGPVVLTPQWTQYTLDLQGLDLRHIVGGFALIAKRSDNPRGAVFYLDEIAYVGAGGMAGSMPEASSEKSPVAEAVASSDAKLPKAIHITVPFPASATVFSQETQEMLDELVGVAVKYPDSKIIIDGHTDNAGPKTLNKKLSEQRVQWVADYFQGKGIVRDRMTLNGYGDERPLQSNDTAQGRQANRRIEVSVVP